MSNRLSLGDVFSILIYGLRHKLNGGCNYVTVISSFAALPIEEQRRLTKNLSELLELFSEKK